MYLVQNWGKARAVNLAFIAVFNNISVMSRRSVLLVEETGVPGENHRTAAIHWQIYHILLYRVDLDWPGFELTTLMVIDTDCIDSCKSNYHMITTTMVPSVQRTVLTRHNNKSEKSAWCSRFVLKQKAQPDFFSARSLKTSHQIDMSLHSNANISWFRPKKYFDVTFYCWLLIGKLANTNFIIFGLTRPMHAIQRWLRI